MPGDATLCTGPRGTIQLGLVGAVEHLPSADQRAPDVFSVVEGRIFRGVFAVNLFPATDPDDYISLRVWTRDGHEEEIGILRRLNDWPVEAQALVRDALARRYYLQTIIGVDEIRLELGHLHLAVRTAHGARQFTMRWSQSQVQDFGERGKILVDLDDNRFLVPDVATLPPREQELFLRYVYW